MRHALLAVIAGCGGGSSAPDASTDAAPVDTSQGLAIEEILPAGGHAIAIDEAGMYGVKIRNHGERSGVVSATLSGSTDFSLENNPCGSLAPDATCEIGLRLTPSVVGAIDAQLAITADPGGSVIADLRGTGLQKNVLQLADRVDFHGRAVGQTSAPLPVIVTNTGTVASGPLMVSIGAGKYSLQSDGCSGQSVPSLATCVFDVVYTPTATPSLGSGGDFATIIVTGTPGGTRSTTAAGYGATILFDEWQYLFPDTTVGAVSAAKTLTLTNTQGFAIGPLTTQTSVLGAAFSVDQDSCDGTTLAAQATCTYVVTFHPSASGFVAGTLGVEAPDIGALSARAAVNLGGIGQ